MDSGTAAVLGALIGSLSAPLTKWLSDSSRYRRLEKTNEIRRQRLRKILSLPNREFFALTYLARSIAADEKTTAKLLLEIGARHSLGATSNKWALISRVPFPGDEAIESDKEAAEEEDKESSN